MHRRLLFLYPIEKDCVCVDVHVCMKEERENEGESGRKIGTEPEFIFFSFHQDDYSVLKNERALPKIFNFKEKFSVKAHLLLLSLVSRKAFNII